MRIRRGHQGDLDDVIALEREVATASHWTRAEYASMLADEDGVRRCLWVAAEGAQLAGFAAGRLVLGEAELESVVVAEALRRQGVGCALCTAVMAWAQECGAHSIDLEVRAKSTGALRLYERLGFRQVGRRRGYYREPEEDGILMRCAWGKD